MGRLLGPFGVHGWVKVKTFTARPGSLGEHSRWLLGLPGGWQETRVEGFEVQSKGPVAKIAGCGDREAAEKLRGIEVALDRAALGEAGEGSYYWVDLVGLEVVDEKGERLGEVGGLFESGGTSVLVVSGTKQRLIPFVPDYVKSVDRDARRITVDWKADYDT